MLEKEPISYNDFLRKKSVYKLEDYFTLTNNELTRIYKFICTKNNYIVCKYEDVPTLYFKDRDGIKDKITLKLSNLKRFDKDTTVSIKNNKFRHIRI